MQRQLTMIEELRNKLYTQGASLVGFADLRTIAPRVRQELPGSISIAVALTPSIIGEIREGPTLEYHDEYRRVNELLNFLATFAAAFLRHYDYKALPLAATVQDTDETLATRLPHKTSATRAGLGWIGKCALLVTEQYGSAVRLTTVLTDAPLPYGQPISESRCDECVACVEVCPGHAPSGREWYAGLSREAFFDAYACRQAARTMAKRRLGEERTICGMCIAACPWTQRYVKNALG